MFHFGFNAGNIFGGIKNLVYKDAEAGLKKRESKLVAVGAEAETTAVGASFQWIDVTNRTLASIGGSSPVQDDGNSGSVPSSGQPARVHSGVDGGTNVTARDELWHFGFVDSGAKTADGKFAFAGSGAVFRYNPKDNGHTTAEVASGTVITGGSLDVQATDQVILVNQNGNFVTGDSSGSIGVGVSYQEIHRRVQAYIGDLNGTSTTASDIQLDPGATINVEAISSGFSVSFVLAGTVRTDPAPAQNANGQDNPPAQGQNNNGNGANTGKSGWAFAGDASVVDLLADQVLAFIDDEGAISADKVTVNAINGNGYVNLAGAFSVVKTDYNSNSNTGLAGSFSDIELHRGEADALGRYDSDTLAYIRRATLAVGDQGLHMTADRRGVYWVTSAGGSGVSQGDGLEVAGSAALTDLDYATRVFLQLVSLFLGGDSEINAKDGVATIAFAGDGVYGGSLGFGTSWAWNQVDRRVQAKIMDSTITQSAGTLSGEAVLWDIAKDNGQTLLPNSYAVAATLGQGGQEAVFNLTGTVAVNEFNTGTTDNAVEASMTGSTYRPPENGADDVTGLSLSATDNTNVLAFAGAVDRGYDLTVGVAVADNIVKDNAAAFVENSTVEVNGGNIDVVANINPEMNAFAVGVAVDSNGIQVAGSGANNTGALTADAHVKGTIAASGLTDTSLSGADDITVHAGITYTDFAAGAGQFGIQSNSSDNGAAIGAAVAINDLSDNQITAMVQDASLSAAGDIEVSAETKMAAGGLILGLAVGGDGAADFALGGSVVDNTIESTTQANVTGTAATLMAGGDIKISALESGLVVSSGAGVISASTSNKGKAAVGAAVATNTVDSTVAGTVEDAASIISTAGTVSVTADRADAQIVSVALGGEDAQKFAR